MKPISTIAAALAVVSTCYAADASALPTATLDFEGASGYVNAIGNYYNGGTDSLGQSGPNLGVSFSSAAVALSNDADFTYYSNAPTDGTVMYAFDSSAVMDVSGGFVDQLSFYYASGAAALNAVQIYSGYDGTGTLLASVSLLANAQLGCSDTAYCHFDLTSVEFAGVAHSVSFSGNAPDVAYDNITLTPIPEPSTFALLLAGLAAMSVGIARRRDE